MSLMKFWKKPLLALLAPLAFTSAMAQADYPNKPVRIIVPYSAGGSSDVVARAISEEMGKALGQPVVVENKAGAGSLLGIQYVAGEAADGYTLVLADVPFTIVPALYRERARYDATKDFAPIALLSVAPMYLFVNPNGKAKTTQEVVAMAKTYPDTVSIGSGGNGSLTHLMAELLMINAGIKMTHVPYKGAAASVTDLAAGQLDASFTTMASATSLMQAGKIRPIGVSGAQRSKEAPGVPTFQEAGVPNMVVESWWGLLAPAGVSQPVLNKLTEATRKALQAPAVKARMAAVGMTEPVNVGPQALSAMVKTDLARWQAVIQRSGIKLD